MITLYHRPVTRSVRIHWLLEELAVDYTLKTPEACEGGPAGYRQVHPFGKVPAIVDGDVIVWESTAIVDYLLGRYDDGRLAPSPGSKGAAEHMSWRHFAEATLISTVADYAINTVWRPEEARDAAVATYARETAAPLLDGLNHHLEGRSVMLGDAFSAVDIMMGHAAISCAMLGLIGEERPHLARYAAAMRARPSFQVISADW